MTFFAFCRPPFSSPSILAFFSKAWIQSITMENVCASHFLNILDLLLFGVRFDISKTFFVVFFGWLLKIFPIFRRRSGECDRINQWEKKTCWNLKCHLNFQWCAISDTNGRTFYVKYSSNTII